jgi:DNA invertase Pin-like site-specific DNA recombinase
MDRLARSVPDFVNFISLVNRYHVRVIIPSQGIDTDYSNPANKMMMNMLATIAEFEHDLISERVKTGMDRAKREGKILGRPRTVIDKLRVKEMREQGLTIRMIAARLKVGKIAVERVVREIRKEEEKCTLV